jgi:protein-L-isoaspartate(D-aspartate) O-methyltransferase
MSNASMVAYLRENGYIKSKRVEEAMLAVDRALFTPAGMPPYDDRPYHIAKGQTISAPGVVSFMLEQLELEPGMKVLEVGTGSGYNAALLSYLVGEQGKVISFEVVPEVCEISKKNLAKLGPPGNIEVHCDDGSAGYEEEAPYDRVIVTAAMPDLDGSHPLAKQLKDDGKAVAPVGGKFFQDVTVYDKRTGASKKVLPVIFVPMVGKQGFDGI